MFKSLIKLAKRLHNDDRGAEGLEKLLILGLIVIPLLGILIYFKDEIGEWVNDQLTAIKDEGAIVTNAPSGR